MPPPYRVLWADLHAHTNLSMDGCEDADDACTARTTPAADALDGDLDVVALTDHAEFSQHTDLETGVVTDIWETTLARVAEHPLAFAGYEWTAHCAGAQNIHRTVLLEEPDACEAYRVPSCELPSRKEQFGREVYTPNEALKAGHSHELEQRLQEVDCPSSRWLAFIHHPAMSTPAGIDWETPGSLLATEHLVEIYSEHGSSECAEIEGDCDWQVSEFHVAEGSIQAMLAAGHRMGFVANTDSHDGRPGSVDAPGPSGQYVDTDEDGLADSVTPHPSPGGLTAILLVEGQERQDVFDALLDRRTIAASAELEPLVVLLGEELPGREVAAGTHPLHVELPDGATWEWVEPDGTVTPEPFEIALEPGEAGYVRIRVGEDRAWASPWWAPPA